MVWQTRYAQRTAEHPELKDRQLTQLNLDAFIHKVQQEFDSNPSSLFAAIESAKQYGKYARQKPDKPQAGPPWTSFSILFFPERNILVLVTPFILGPPGSYGVVKICYLLEEQAQGIRIDFSKLFALKVIHGPYLLEKLQSSISLAQTLDTKGSVICRERLGSEKKYILMPAYPGKDLLECLSPYLFPKQWDTKTDVMNFAQRLALSIALLEPLEQMHRQGLVHGDIKPENFVITIRAEAIEAHIVDLDMMCKAGTLLPAILSSEQQIINYGVGTYLYMPPELLDTIFRHKLPQIQASSAWDVYSVGICIAILFIGKIGPGAILDSRSRAKHPGHYFSVNINNLTKFPWSIYFPNIFPKQYEPLVQSLLIILGGFLAPEPKGRSRITQDLINDLKRLLAEAQKLTYTSRCPYYTPLWPGDKTEVLFAKPQVLAV